MLVHGMFLRFATHNTNASSVNGVGSFIAVEMRLDGNAVEAFVHVFDRVDHRAAGAEQRQRHLVAVHATKTGVAGQQADCVGAMLQHLANATIVVSVACQGR